MGRCGSSDGNPEGRCGKRRKRLHRCGIGQPPSSHLVCIALR